MPFGRGKPALPAIVATMVVLTGVAATFAAAAALDQDYASRERVQVTSSAATLRAELESALNARLSMVDAMSAYAISNDAIDPVRFDEFSRSLVTSHERFVEGADDQAIRSLQLAPDAVVAFVHPRQGNEEAIGHDLLADPERRDAVRRSVENQTLVLAGPFELRQGGTGVIARQPIYTEGDEFWGLGILVMNFDALVAGSSLESGDGLSFGLRGTDGLGSEGEIFYGDQSLWASDPVLATISFPNGSWELAAVPAAGWARGWPWLTDAIRFMGVLVSLLLAYSIYRWTASRHEAVVARAALRSLIDTANAPILATGADGAVTEWNRAAEELTGVSKDDAVGQSFLNGSLLDRVRDQDRPIHERTVRRVLRDGALEELEIAIDTAHNGEIVLSLVLSPEPATGGLVAVGRDITARRQLDHVVAENRAMARAAELKDQFVASISHELRTPLNAVIGLTSMLLRRTYGELNSKQAEYLEQVAASGRHLLEIINDILDIAKIEANEEWLQVEPVVAGDLVTQAVGHVAPTARGRNVDIEMTGTLTAEVECDSRRLVQALTNVVANAVAFSPAGETVTVEVISEGDTVALDVIDRGPGIAPEDQDRIFRPFHQVDGSLHRSHEGTGLGLTLSRHIVRTHGGDISVASSAGGGARFRLSLPAPVGSVEPDVAAPGRAR